MERTTDPTKFPIKESNFKLEKPKWYILDKDIEGKKRIIEGVKPPSNLDILMENRGEFDERKFGLYLLNRDCVKYPALTSTGLSSIFTLVYSFKSSRLTPIPNIFYYSFLGFFIPGMYICNSFNLGFISKK